MTDRERKGFVDGFFDCYIYELKAPNVYQRYSKIEYRNLVTKFYEDPAADHADATVPSVIAQLRDPPNFVAHSAQAEHASGRHGGDDGLYWLDIGLDGNTERAGFVEGYLSCHDELNHGKGGRFSRSTADYVRLITRWYRIHDENGTNDAGREPVSIAATLYRFRDVER